MPHQLNLATLNDISATAKVPHYQRSQLSPGIVHIGVGNFHRAHQAIYLDDLFNLGEGHDFALIGAGVRATDAKMRETLRAQDFLTTVVEQEADGSAARITGSMIDFLAPGDSAALIAALADPAIRIVSLTITEGGYFIDPASGKFDPTHLDIAADAANMAAPKTAFGLILAGLIRRRAAGLAPFTVMSCDNIPHNGVVTRNAVAGLADLVDGALARFVREQVAFPNGMVDRITPATTDRERAITLQDYDIADAWPVFCEGFKQWVLEDNFPMGRPALEKVGVTFVSDVSPYELMKIRILNGGHAAIAYPAALMDIHFVHEAMENPLIRAFLDKLEREEIIPCVPPVPDSNLDDYYGMIVRRFANPKIADTIARLCLDGSNRQPKFILPSTRDRLAAGKSIVGLSLVSALWCRYCAQTSDSGLTIAPNDESADRLKTAALAAKTDPMAFLAMGDIFGDVADSPVFQKLFASWLTRLWSQGAKAVLTAYVAGD
jgi:mannitol 2-dehydrogenase